MTDWQQVALFVLVVAALVATYYYGHCAGRICGRREREALMRRYQNIYQADISAMHTDFRAAMQANSE